MLRRGRPDPCRKPLVQARAYPGDGHIGADTSSLAGQSVRLLCP
jgi:hypothetical protein